MTYLIKIGGSLIPRYVPALYQALKEIRKKSHCRIFIFPGGGECADLVRKFRRQVSLHDPVTHKMANACLDQNAYLISDMCKCRCISSLQEIETIKEYPVVIAPYRILTDRAPFTGYNLNIDVLSSDSSALYLAYILKAETIIATDVDGVLKKDPKSTKGKNELLSEIPSDFLLGIKRGGPLDKTIPHLIDKYRKKVWVVNGKLPQRLTTLLLDPDKAKGTLIYPRP